LKISREKFFILKDYTYIYYITNKEKMEITLGIEDIPIGIVEACRKKGIFDSELISEYTHILELAIGEKRSTDWCDEEVISHMTNSIDDIRELNGTLKGISVGYDSENGTSWNFKVFLNGKEILTTMYVTDAWFHSYWGRIDNYEILCNRVYVTWEKEVENPNCIVDVLKSLTPEEVKKYNLEKVVKEIDSEYNRFLEEIDCLKSEWGGILTQSEENDLAEVKNAILESFIRFVINDYYLENIPEHYGFTGKDMFVSNDDIH
jgi:hypothetical protein